jgi:GPH family glycoside/pentoside/hexuronide:cation symporter
LDDNRKLNLTQQLSYALGNFGVAFGPVVVSAWLGYFYYGQETPDGQPIIYVGTATFGVFWFLCNAINGITDPVVGYLSDHTKSRWGRRKPWIVIGAPLFALSFFFLWAPLTDKPSLSNNIILFSSLFGFWFFFTVIVAPYLSLLPEITPYNNERVRISAYMGVFEVLGNLLGNLLPPICMAVFAGGLMFLGNGYQVMAFVTGIATMVFFILSMSKIKETYTPPNPGNPHNKEQVSVKRAFTEFGSTFKNPAFLPYVLGVGFYRMAIATIVFITPFVTTKLLASYPQGKTESYLLGLLGAVNGKLINWELAAGYLMMLVLVGAAALFPLINRLAAISSKRVLYIISLVWFGAVMILMSSLGNWPIFSPFFQAVTLFLLAAFPVSIALVVIRPILADVIDHDEKLTGLRREGVYNGIEGLILKIATGSGPLVAGLLFSSFGNSLNNDLGIRLCGPVAGTCLLAAAIAFMKYPIKK